MPSTTCVQVEHLRLEHLLAAEGEQLARQRGRALAGVADLLDASSRRGSSASRLAEQELGVAEDRRSAGC